MAKGQGKRIADEVRAQVIAALLAGQGVSQVAREYKLHHQTVSRMKKEIPADELCEVVHKKREQIADLISENLQESFIAIRNMLKVTANNEWLIQQPASELATFVGVTSDKIFRILEAIENAQPKGEQP